MSYFDKIAILTPQEREVLNLLGRLYAPKSIARKLFVSKRTVDTHIQNIKSKLGIRKITGLFHFAHRAGIVVDPVDYFNEPRFRRRRFFG